MSKLGDAIDYLPPGESSCDPCVKEIDTVAFALERVRTYLFWIEEHRTSFEAIQATDPESANKELHYLANVTHQAGDILTV